jgi:hypothetical protein
MRIVSFPVRSVPQSGDCPTLKDSANRSRLPVVHAPVSFDPSGRHRVPTGWRLAGEAASSETLKVISQCEPALRAGNVSITYSAIMVAEDGLNTSPIRGTIAKRTGRNVSDELQRLTRIVIPVCPNDSAIRFGHSAYVCFGGKRKLAIGGFLLGRRTNVRQVLGSAAPNRLKFSRAAVSDKPWFGRPRITAASPSP